MHRVRPRVLPVTTIDGKTYAQSLAILRYYGKKAKLCPTDDLAALAVDHGYSTRYFDEVPAGFG